MDDEEVRAFAIALHARFLEEATRVAKLVVEAMPESDPQNLYEISRHLIDRVPDGGNTPQRIVGLLMQTYHEELQTGIQVEGYLDSASVTSTTSKKPGDVTEEQLDGTVLTVYEVTVKHFGAQRVSESYDTLDTYNRNTGSSLREVIVICRHEDVHEDAHFDDSDTYLGKVEYQDVTYFFVEIYEWIAGQLLRMPADARLGFHSRFADYVSDPNTSEKLKRAWAQLQP
jgi:hypothetical protein